MLNLLPLLLLFFLLAFCPCLDSRRQSRPKGSGSSGFCLFPEANERPFFFDIRSDSAPRSIILDTVVEPVDASLSIANIRSNNLPEELDLSRWLSIEKRANGQFLLFTDEPLGLPPYPSPINETLLYVTARCGQRLYPLSTIRIRAINGHAPQWINGDGAKPYEMAIPKNAQSGAVFDTPLLALDQDPADHYPLSFSIEPPHDHDFALILSDPVSPPLHLLSTLPPPFSRRIEHWRDGQFPPIVQLKVVNPKALAAKPVHLLNITVSDNGIPAEVRRQSWTQLKVTVKDLREIAARFSRIEYFGNFTKELRPGAELVPGEPLMAIFPSQKAGDRIIYELDRANPYGQLFRMDQESGRIRLATEPIPEGIPQTIELDILARLQPKAAASEAIGGGPIVRSKLVLTDQTQVRLTYFTQCHYVTHLAENPSAFTRVLQFNFKGDVDSVELLNGTDLFKVDQYGQMTVRPGVEDIDREKIDRIVVKARLRSKAALHPKSLELCQLATADILIDDVNDHSPRFTRRSYRFRIEANPFNNTEVGSLRAVDEDRAEFGRVRYRMLDEFVPDGQGGEEPLPFVLFQADGAATLFFVIRPLHLQLRQPYKPQSEYTFTVEAFDSDEDPRTSRVSVNVRLEDGGANKDDGGAREFVAAQQEEEEVVEEAARDEQPAEDGGEEEKGGGGEVDDGGDRGGWTTQSPQL